MRPAGLQLTQRWVVRRARRHVRGANSTQLGHSRRVIARESAFAVGETSYPTEAVIPNGDFDNGE